MLKEKFTAYPDLLVAKEASEISRYSEWQIRKFAREGKIPSIKIGSKVLIPKEQFLDYLESNMTGAVA